MQPLGYQLRFLVYRDSRKAWWPCSTHLHAGINITPLLIYHSLGLIYFFIFHVFIYLLIFNTEINECNRLLSFVSIHKNLTP